MNKNNNFTMSGTEYSSVFNGVVSTAAGKLGYRSLGGDSYRVRVVPTDGNAIAGFGSDWKQPEGPMDGRTRRHSKVVYNQQDLLTAVAEAGSLLEAASGAAKAKLQAKVEDAKKALAEAEAALAQA